jgi:hypothetical protein
MASAFFNRSKGHAILDTSGKPPARQLCMFISEDMPDLHARVRDLLQRYTVGRDRVTTNMATHGQISWTLEDDGEPFGFTVQVTSTDRLLASDVMGTVDEPILFPDGYKLLYLVEGGGGPPPHPSAALAPARVSKATMCITAGENALFKEVERLMEQIYPGQNAVRMLPLNSGDVTWLRPDPAEGCGGGPPLLQFGFMVERKTAADFVATITDSRKMQLQVMLDTAPTPQQIVYLIEGDVMGVRGGVNNKARIGSVVYPIFRHGVRVAQVADTAASAAFLVNLHLQMEACDEDKLRAHNMYFNSKLDHARKRADYTGVGGRDELIYDLTVVEDISSERAAAIAAVYPTFGALMCAYLGCADPDHMLEDIMVPGKSTDKPRRLGPAASAAVARRFAIADLQRHIAGAVPAPAPPRPAAKAAVEIEKHGEDDDDDDDDPIEDITPPKKRSASQKYHYAGDKTAGRIREPRPKKISPVFQKAKRHKPEAPPSEGVRGQALPLPLSIADMAAAAISPGARAYTAWK